MSHGTEVFKITGRVIYMLVCIVFAHESWPVVISMFEKVNTLQSASCCLWLLQQTS